MFLQWIIVLRIWVSSLNIIKERFYEGDDALMAATGMTFATSFDDRPHKYFSPLDGVYLAKAQQFGFINFDEIESEVEVDGEEEGDVEGGDEEGVAMLAAEEAS